MAIIAPATDYINGLIWLAKLSTPEVTYELIKASIQDNRIRVFANFGGKVGLAAEAIITGSSIHKTTLTLQTEDQGEWVLTRIRGCACGNPLKHFNPRTWIPPTTE